MLVSTLVNIARSSALGCSSLNAYLYRNHLREDDRCSCGYPETVAHFFYECNTYIILRNRTIATIPLPTNIDILLSGCPLYDKTLILKSSLIQLQSSLIQLESSVIQLRISSSLFELLTSVIELESSLFE